jgi:ABC-type oligopeptide transport system substrate-binding subunit
MLYLGFNTRSGLCRSSEVRQALALGIDRESIAQVDFARHAAPATLPVHPNSALYDTQTAAALSYAPEELNSRLASLQLSGRSLRLLVNSENAARVHAAERIAQQLGWTGLEIRVEKLAFEDYALALEKGDFDLYLAEVTLTADFDLSALLLSEGTLNYGGWSSSEFAPLLSHFRSSQGLLRAIHAKAMYEYLAQEVPIAPICFKNGCVLTRWGRLSGLQPVRGNVFYRMSGWNIS